MENGLVKSAYRQTRRLRRYPVSIDGIMAMLNWKCDNGYIRLPTFPQIPDGAVVVGVYFSGGRQCFEIVVYHEGFEEIPVGQVLPDFAELEVSFVFHIPPDKLKEGQKLTAHGAGHTDGPYLSRVYPEDIEPIAARTATEVEIMASGGKMRLERVERDQVLARTMRHVWNQIGPNADAIVDDDIEAAAEANAAEAPSEGDAMMAFFKGKRSDSPIA